MGHLDPFHTHQERKQQYNKQALLVELTLRFAGWCLVMARSSWVEAL